MSDVRPHINPEILSWARERVNYKPELLAKRVGVSEERYLKWENGEAKPTHRQLKILGKALGRSGSFFYLKKTPKEPEPRLEMRRVYGSNPNEDSKDLAIEIEEMLNRRNLTIELFDRLKETLIEIPYKADVNKNPEDVAKKVRDWLKVSFNDQLNWKSKYEALKGWRVSLENNGFLPFQLSGISIEEARGFAINYRPLPIVAFNSNDSVTGRIFTLMHEVGHIILGESVIHELFPLESDNNIEVWCNQFSAAILMPKELIIELADHNIILNSQAWSKNEVESLSRRFWVSPSAMVRRLHALRLISPSNFSKLKKIFDDYRSEKKETGGGNHYNNVLARLGTLLPSLAFQGFYSGEINIRDLSQIMGTSVKKMGKMEEKVMGVTYSFK